jgi:hypothetical protein
MLKIVKLWTGTAHMAHFYCRAIKKYWDRIAIIGQCVKIIERTWLFSALKDRWKSAEIAVWRMLNAERLLG